MSHTPKLQYSIIRVIRRPGKKPIRFYVRNRFGFKVFGFASYRMLTKKYRKAGLEYEVLYHLPKYPTATHVSPHFTWAEFACKDPQRTPVPKSLRKNAIKLARGLEMMRALLDRPMGLLSVYRTPEWNTHVGGARYSQHMKATAADHNVPNGKQYVWVAAAKQVPIFNGIGIYPGGGVHTDVRSGPRVFWDDWGR